MGHPIVRVNYFFFWGGGGGHTFCYLFMKALEFNKKI